jgi:hypothetical protein
MAMRNIRTNEPSQGPGLTPIDNAAQSGREFEKHEPDRTTGRLPSQTEKTRKPKNKKRARRNG